MTRLTRCSCGRMPVIRARQTREGVSTQVTCPGVSCGAQGLEYIDDVRDEDSAADLWNRHGGRKAA